MKTNPSVKKLLNREPTSQTGPPSEFSEWLHHLPDAVIITNQHFQITGWNDASERLHGLPGAMGKNIFSLLKIEISGGSAARMQNEILQKGRWEGEIIYHRHDGEKFIFRTTANVIIDDKVQPTAVIFVCHNITREKSTEKKLAEAEASYEKLVNTLVDGVLMIGKDGNILTCNRRAADILGLSMEKLIGKKIPDNSWKIIRPDGSHFPQNEFPAMVSLQTGFPQRHVKMGIETVQGSLAWLSVNSEALIRQGEFEPYAVVISFSDITHEVNRDEELRKSNERFYYVSKITTDAIWDMDLVNNRIYRSEAFSDLSGYSHDEIKPSLDWWFNKIHAEDRERVKRKVNDYIRSGSERWEDEYRFMCADGHYKFLLDTGIILYRNGQPVRILGAIRDLTERKKLELQLLIEQEQKHKAISQAVFATQEEERNSISRELHDNVNQLLMSAKLYMSSARNEPMKAKEYLEKAIQYQTMAVAEIRKISHQLNSSLVKIVGLRKSIDDITENLMNLQSIKVKLEFDPRLEKSLSDDQQLMIYRIIQEQSSNILKYAQATKVTISIQHETNRVHLLIVDNGKGFDTAFQAKGIGLSNISNRVNAFNGEVKVITAPGKGCTLEVSFPLTFN